MTPKVDIKSTCHIIYASPICYIYAEIIHPLIKGIYISGTEKITIEPTHDGFNMTKEGEKSSIYYMYEPYGHYQFLSPEKGKSMSLIFDVAAVFIINRDNDDGGKLYARFIPKPEEKKKPPLVVKQENKPVPVTENKTVAKKGPVSRKWYIGYWHLSYTADYSVDVEELGDNLTIKFVVEPNSTGSAYGFLNGKIVTAKKSSPYSGQYRDMIGAPVWKGVYPERTGMVPCSWVYYHKGEVEMLIMINDEYVFKLYKTRHSQGY